MRKFRVGVILFLVVLLMTGCKKKFNPYEHLMVILQAPERVYSDEVVEYVISHTKLPDIQASEIETLMLANYPDTYRVSKIKADYTEYGNQTVIMGLFRVEMSNSTEASLSHFLLVYAVYEGDQLVQLEKRIAEYDWY